MVYRLLSNTHGFHEHHRGSGSCRASKLAKAEPVSEPHAEDWAPCRACQHRWGALVCLLHKCMGWFQHLQQELLLSLSCRAGGYGEVVLVATPSWHIVCSTCSMCIAHGRGVWLWDVMGAFTGAYENTPHRNILRATSIPSNKAGGGSRSTKPQCWGLFCIP